MIPSKFCRKYLNAFKNPRCWREKKNCQRYTKRTLCISTHNRRKVWSDSYKQSQVSTGKIYKHSEPKVWSEIVATWRLLLNLLLFVFNAKFYIQMDRQTTKQFASATKHFLWRICHVEKSILILFISVHFRQCGGHAGYALVRHE